MPGSKRTGGRGLARMLALLALLVAGTASAQIVNVQGLFDEEAKEGLSGGLEGAVDWRTGANAYLAVRGGLSAQWRRMPHQVLVLARGEYGVSGTTGETILGRVLEHLRYRHHLHERLALEGFVQHESDRFRRTELRALVGAGPRWVLWREEKGVEEQDPAQRGSVVAGLGLMGDLERLGGGDFADAGARYAVLRLSSYLLARIRLVQGVELVQTLYAQPNLRFPADVRLLEDTQLVTQPNAHLTLGIAFALGFDNAPPLGVPKLDSQLRTTLGWTF